MPTKIELFINDAHQYQVDDEQQQILAPHHMSELGKVWNKDIELFIDGAHYGHLLMVLTMVKLIMKTTKSWPHITC